MWEGVFLANVNLAAVTVCVSDDVGATDEVFTMETEEAELVREDASVAVLVEVSTVVVAEAVLVWTIAVSTSVVLVTVLVNDTVDVAVLVEVSTIVVLESLVFW